MKFKIQNKENPRNGGGPLYIKYILVTNADDHLSDGDSRTNTFKKIGYRWVKEKSLVGEM